MEEFQSLLMEYKYVLVIKVKEQLGGNCFLGKPDDFYNANASAVLL
jgi:hypothetical protein